MIIKTLVPDDFDQVLSFVKKIIQAGETYALPHNMSDEEIKAYFFQPENAVYVAEEGGNKIGVFYLRPNQRGGGAHVANAGFMVDEKHRGKGLAFMMLTECLKQAKEKGFEAMQFNFIISTNEQAIRVWKKAKFKIVGILPKAFVHPTQGKVDVFVMHRFL